MISTNIYIHIQKATPLADWSACITTKRSRVPVPGLSQFQKLDQYIISGWQNASWLNLTLENEDCLFIALKL